MPDRPSDPASVIRHIRGLAARFTGLIRLDPDAAREIAREIDAECVVLQSRAAETEAAYADSIRVMEGRADSMASRLREVEAERDRAYDKRDEWLAKSQKWGALLVDAQATVARQAETLQAILDLPFSIPPVVTDLVRAVLASPEATLAETDSTGIGRDAAGSYAGGTKPKTGASVSASASPEAVATEPTTGCPYCGKPWGPGHHDYVSAIGYEGCRPAGLPAAAATDLSRYDVWLGKKAAATCSPEKCAYDGFYCPNGCVEMVETEAAATEPPYDEIAALRRAAQEEIRFGNFTDAAMLNTEADRLAAALPAVDAPECACDGQGWLPPLNEHCPVHGRAVRPDLWWDEPAVAADTEPTT